MSTLDMHSRLNDVSKSSPRSIVFLLTPKKSIGYLESHYTIRQCLEKMKHHGYTAMPVISKEGHYVGTVNEGDFLWELVKAETYDVRDYEDVLLKDIMREDWNPPITIDFTVDGVVERILDQNFLPVVDDRSMFMGIITRKSVLKHIQNERFG